MKHLYTLLSIALLTILPVWGQDSLTYHYEINHLGRNINTPSAEAGGLVFNDSILIYSSMQNFDKKDNWLINFEDEIVQVCEASISKNGHIEWGKPSTRGFNTTSMHCGNVTYDKKGNAFYFTRCKEDSSIMCEIYVMKYDRGRWQKPKKLGGDVNKKGYTSTQPSIGYLKDGTTLLYFCSNRPGGIGGDDIWYVVLENGKPEGNCINLGIPINTKGNEITPYYDNNTHTLYYSSDFEKDGEDMDIYYSYGGRNSWQKPQAMPAPINSKYNDIYFCTNPNNSQEGFLTSNRADSYFIQDSSCCNDIYKWERKPNPPLLLKPAEPKAKLPLVDLMPAIQTGVGYSYQARALMPIKLYFHNDEPDPKSKSPITTDTYFQTYNKYMFMRYLYLLDADKIKDSLARENEVFMVNDFFENEVHINCDKFEQFLKLLTEDIRMGSHVSLTICGYASRPHSKQYNFNLSKRRISSIINQIMTYEDGILQNYIGSGRYGSLQIKEVPYGDTKAESERNASLYSLTAAQDRRIEIIDYNYLDSDPYAKSVLTMPKGTEKIGELPDGETTDIAIKFKHSAKETTALDFISVGLPNISVTGYTKLVPGKELVVYLHIDNRKVTRTDSILIPLTMRVKGEDITQTIFLEYQITLSDK